VVSSKPSHTRLASAYPEAEIVIADLTETSEASRALEGATVVYHIGPPFHPRETEIGINMIDTAVASKNCKHFVYSSVLNPQLRKMLHHDCKRYVEDYLLESGLNHTVLQPTHFMESSGLAMLLKFGKEKEGKDQELVYDAHWDPSI
jgi:uncharacterized protein YbjT (DUF2867 family)